MKSGSFLILILALGLLSACGNSRSPAPSPAATSAPTAAATVQPTATTGPPPTLTPAPPRPPLPTATALPPANPSPTINSLSLPAIPALAPSARYRLRTPDSDAFLQVLEYAIRHEQSFNGAGRFEYEEQLLTADSNAILPLITDDFYRFFPSGFPNSAKFIENGHFSSNRSLIWTPRPLEEIILSGLVTLLNEQSILLHDGQTIDLFGYLLTAAEIELGDDSDEEWLLEIDSPRFGLHTWLPLKRSQSGQLSVIPNDFLPVTYPWSANTLIDQDVTGSGRNDIIIVQSDYLLAGNSGGFVAVYSWSGSRLQWVDSIHFNSFSGRSSLDYEIGDLDQDGLTELHLYWKQFRGFGCSWDYEDIYRWPEGVARHTVTDEQTPDTPECLLAQAVWDQELDSLQRLRLLQQVTSQWTVETAPSADLLAYTYLQSAIQYAALGLDSDAERILARFEQFPADSHLRQVVLAEWAAAEGSLPALCQRLRSAVQAGLDSEIDSYLTVAAAGGYPQFPDPYPDAICNDSLLLAERAQNTYIPDGEDIAQALARIDYLATISQAVNLDNDLRQEWLAVTAKPNTVAIVDAVGGRWRWHFLSTEEDVIELAAFFSDINGDGIDELLLSARHSAGCVYPETTSHAYTVRVIALTGETDYPILARQRYCANQPLLLENFEPATLGAALNLPFWDLLADAFPWQAGAEPFSESSFFAYLTLLTAEVQARESPEETAIRLENLLAALPANDPLAGQAAPRIRYLLGLNYELMGRQEAAVGAYLDLIQQAPESAWSWLAWMRLEVA